MIYVVVLLFASSMLWDRKLPNEAQQVHPMRQLFPVCLTMWSTTMMRFAFLQTQDAIIPNDESNVDTLDISSSQQQSASKGKKRKKRQKLGRRDKSYFLKESSRYYTKYEMDPYEKRMHSMQMKR